MEVRVSNYPRMEDAVDACPAGDTLVFDTIFEIPKLTEEMRRKAFLFAVEVRRHQERLRE